MTASHLRLIGLSSALVLATTLSALPVSAQGPGRPPKQVAPTLDAVLPQLNAVVQVESAQGAHLAAVRVGADHAVTYVPGTAPLQVDYRARVDDDAWVRVNDAKIDPRRLVLLRITPRLARTPALTAKPLPATAGFIVGAAGRSRDLDIQTVWLEPGGSVELPAGAVVFGTDGAFLGLVTERDGQRAIMPAADVLAAAAALEER